MPAVRCRVSLCKFVAAVVVGGVPLCASHFERLVAVLPPDDLARMGALGIRGHGDCEARPKSTYMPPAIRTGKHEPSLPGSSAG